jgi:Mg-chelatase subunit ChlD
MVSISRLLPPARPPDPKELTVTHPPRLSLALLLAGLLACAQPPIEGAATGGKGGKGGKGGSSGSAGTGGSHGSRDADFGLNYGDAGVSVGEAGSGGPNVDDKSCAGELHEGKLVPLDLLLLLDISGSMEEGANTQSKWKAVRDAFTTFIEDPKSAGLGVGLETFPPPSKTCAKDTDCGAGTCEEKGVCSPPATVATTQAACDAAKQAMCDDQVNECTKYGLCAQSGLRCPTVGMACAGGAMDGCMARPKFCVMPMAGCDITAYQTPIVAIADLPGAVPALEKAMAGIVPQGATPTTQAVTGALAQLRARAMSNPNRKPVLVLATDGLPNSPDCTSGNTINAAAMQLSNAAMGMPGILTYVIGIYGANQSAQSMTALGTLATAGGTGTPFSTVGNDVSQRFLDAINQIRGTALGCEFKIPQPNNGGTLDFDKLNVRLKIAGIPTDLGYAGSMAGCDPMRDGWYYDTDPKMAPPTRVILCDASCQKVKMPGNSADTSVELQVGCKTNVIK